MTQVFLTPIQVPANARGGGWNSNYTVPTKHDIYNYVVNNLVDIGSVQNITGVKTFTAFPLTPSSAPTTDYQVTNKKYVDDNFITPTSSNTFSNKTINLSANTFVTTVAQLNTAISDGDLMTSELAIAYAVAL